MDVRAYSVAFAFTLLAACSDPESSGNTGSGAAASASGTPSATGTGGAATSSGAGGGDGGDSCEGGAPVVGPTGATLELNPGDSLAAALAMAKPGDLVQVHGGNYPHEDIEVVFADDVWIAAAEGEVPVFEGLRFEASQHVVLQGLAFTGTLTLDGSSFFRLEKVSIDLGDQDQSGLHIHGQGSAGPSHHITVVDSSIHGGARTVFILGVFAPNEGWNHDLVFSGCDFVCGTHNCFQISGGRDTIIADSKFHDPKGDGVLTAGATRVQILRNVMIGDPGVGVGAVRLATPGAQWDNYDGVENMISSEILVANNLMHGWGARAIELDASVDIDIVFNTVADGEGFGTWARVPVDTSGNTILEGNTKIRLWNNILTNVSIDSADPDPDVYANNLVVEGGGGDALINGDPEFADTMTYELSASSPAVDSGLVDAKNPADDLLGRVRTGAPDRGAMELGAMAPVCP